MKVKLGDIINAQPVLNKVFGASIGKASTTYKIVRLKREVMNILEDFNQVRSEYLEKYAKPVNNNGEIVDNAGMAQKWVFWQLNESGEPIMDLDGNPVIDEEAVTAFSDEMSELLETLQEVNVMLKEFDFDQINEALEEPLSTDETFVIGWCLEDLRDMYEEE